MKHLRSPSSST